MSRSKDNVSQRIHLFFTGATVFFLLISALGFGFFLLGNFQAFIPRSQFMLLEVIKAGGLLSVLSGVLLGLSRFFMKLGKKRKKTSGFLLALGALLGGSFILAVAHFILALTRGFR